MDLPCYQYLCDLKIIEHLVLVLRYLVWVLKTDKDGFYFFWRRPWDWWIPRRMKRLSSNLLGPERSVVSTPSPPLCNYFSIQYLTRRFPKANEIRKVRNALQERQTNANFIFPELKRKNKMEGMFASLLTTCIQQRAGNWPACPRQYNNKWYHRCWRCGLVTTVAWNQKTSGRNSIMLGRVQNALCWKFVMLRQSFWANIN